MNKITAPIQPNEMGAKVRNLHEALQALVAQGDIFADRPSALRDVIQMLVLERAIQRYGSGTERLVAMFQEAHGLKPTGVVDQATADLINHLLFKSEPADPKEPEKPVEPDDPKGDPKDEPTPGEPSEDPDPKDMYVVTGRVVNHERRGVSDLQLVVIDKFVGGERHITYGKTSERGVYEIVYDPETEKSGKMKPDIQVGVLGSDRTIVARSDVRYNAAPIEDHVDIEVPESNLPRPTEYRRLVQELVPHVGARNEAETRKRLAALQENETQQDITYLANKTGWDARMVALTAMANQFSEQTGIEPDYFYALFRAGLPANGAMLNQLPLQVVQDVWERAVDQHILEPELAKKLPHALEQFKEASVTHLLEEPALIGVGSFKQLVEGTLDDVKSQRRFAQLYYEHREHLGTFWNHVRKEFPQQAERLQLDSQLGALTINNAHLIRKLHERHKQLRSPIDLIEGGFYQAQVWQEYLHDDVSIPDEIPGADRKAKVTHYANYLASQLRLSYPTAVVGKMVETDAIPLQADQPIKAGVVKFLREHQGEFELGVHPVQQFLHQKKLSLEAPVLSQMKALQRVYQISPSDDAMGALYKHNLDSAYAVVRYDEDTFVRDFGHDLGGAKVARLTYAKAQQIHHTVLNITTAYMLEQSAPALAVMKHLPALRDEAIRQPESDGIAYPTLENLFGGMEYCACEHCRSWLSPAAYLVDLLQFLDPPTFTQANPLDVLLARRPDIQHLQLTCENTNTVVPYIDLVNEILEHFVVSGSLTEFIGHNHDGDANAEELLASPQFVYDAAYKKLEQAVYPSLLPFHQPLEMMRRYFHHTNMPLSTAMERLRTSDAYLRPEGTDDPAYGWQDILLERLQVSRAEFAILADSAIPLHALYGEDPDAVSEQDLVAKLSNAKTIARKLGVSLDELIAITRTRLINPDSHLIPALDRLGIGFVTIQAYFAGEISAAELAERLPEHFDPRPYGGDVAQWLQRHELSIMGLIVLTDPKGEGADLCSFDHVELRYAHPNPDTNRLQPVEFLKLVRFVRLWRKLGWSIAEVDQAIAALYPAPQMPRPDDTDDAARQRLDAGFDTLLMRLANLLQVMDSLDLTVARDLPSLLACWAPMDTHGPRSLYRQLLLNPTILTLDTVFEADGDGYYLNDPGHKLMAHAEALRAACNLTQAEWDQICDHLDYNEQTELNLLHVSEVFRHGYMARALRLSVQEFIALKRLSGLDPFQPLDTARDTDESGAFGDVRPQAIRMIECVREVQESPLGVEQLLYLVQHRDLSGQTAPSRYKVLDFAQTLRHDLVRIERDYTVDDDPSGEQVRDQMAQVYGSSASDAFFGLLHGTMDTGQPEAQAFFARYPELQSLYNDFVASNAPHDVRLAALIDDFAPELRERAKRLQVDHAVSTEAKVDLHLASRLLGDAAVFHAEHDPNLPIRNDFLALTQRGLSADLYFGPQASGTPDSQHVAPEGIQYRDGTTMWPQLPEGTTVFSGIWSGYVAPPDHGSYAFHIESHADTEIALWIDGEQVDLVRDGDIWQTQERVEIQAGRLHALRLTAQGVKDRLVLKWERKGLGCTVIPPSGLYPAEHIKRFRRSYARLMKALSFADTLGLVADELVHFATHADYTTGSKGWLNDLPTAAGEANEGKQGEALLQNVQALLRYRSLKSVLGVDDDRLLAVLRAPETPDAIEAFEQVTGWSFRDGTALLGHFGLSPEALEHLAVWWRLHEAMTVLQAWGAGASTLLTNTTNAPTGEFARQLQGALRARYDRPAWLQLIQPINDDLRRMRRDALVSHVLHQMAQDDRTAHIDTPDKLFEYFLIDVQMDPCMQTSRIRQAISSVQLFVQRCLLNLEVQVDSRDMKAKQWAWMQRYRVWEANRKVFLWPENWLEPELRDNKSPFFTELESELLESDITDEAAANAFVNYLEKLDEVAKLDVCGMYVETDGTDQIGEEIVHVIARTPGTRRIYYYRRQEGGVAWSPWEKVDLDIEDTPVLPVVWQGRLFLFWLSVRQEGEAPASSNNAALDLTSVRPDQLKDVAGESKVQVLVTLHWSEYYHGKWQAPNSSDVNRPVSIGSFAPSGENALNREDLVLRSAIGGDGQLHIRVGYPSKAGRSFELYNTHSLPVVHRPSDTILITPKRDFSRGDQALTLVYRESNLADYRRKVLEPVLPFGIVAPMHGSGRITDPFFLQDARHVFYVTTTSERVRVRWHLDVGVRLPVYDVVIQPPIVVLPDLIRPEPVFFPPDLVQPGVGNPQPIEQLLEHDLHVVQALGVAGTIRFGDRLIGPQGSMQRK